MSRTMESIARIMREAMLRSIGATMILLTGYPMPQSPTLENENDIMNVETIIRDRQQIDQVLNYWFGQASPDGSQKSLWMIASSSAELLKTVDEDISDKFSSLIVTLSEDSNNEECSSTLSRWTRNVELFGWQGKLAAIIALDQMSRHIHRHYETLSQRDGGNRSSSNDHPIIPGQYQLDRIAYDVAKRIQHDHAQELSSGMIPLPMRIFGIMPLRHASTVSDLSIVQQDVEATAELHDEMDRMVRRFRKATNRRMAILQDETRRAGKLGAVSCCDGDVNANVGGGGKVEEEQILECFPFDADMSTAGDHVVVKTMKVFLCKMNILQICDAQTKVKFLSRRTSSISCPTDDSSDNIPTVIVSLSGGVDSMVIASSLAHLRNLEANRRNKHPDTILRIVGIHIDYANRPESAAEASYVGKYCETIGAKFVCRRIDEVTRGITARDDYERIAREIRFDLYRQYCAEAKDGTEEHGIGIMLGHHRGDLRENVISNAHKGCGPLDLSGMTVVSKNDGVTLFRPLLSLEKTHIFDYSHKFGVPYFKDTTPHWSTRGKLRNRLIPLLEEIYGEGSMDHLSSLAEESDEARALVEGTIMSPFMHQIKHYPMGFSFETSQWKDYSLFFWKIVLRKTMHSSGLGMFSDKSVDCFLDRVRARSVREGWLQCRRDYAVYLQVDGRVFVFYPNSFPFGNGKNGGGYDNSVEFHGYGLDRSIQVGPWTVKSEFIEVSDDVANKLLNTKVFQNVEQLMSGDIQYHLNVPVQSGAKEPRPLVRVTGFTKFNRPAAWKGVDLKVETTLPLLGVDQSVISDADISGHQDNDKYAVVRVHLVLNSETKQIRASKDSEKRNGVGTSKADIEKQNKVKYNQPMCTVTINKGEEMMTKEQRKHQSGGDENSVAKATKAVDEETLEDRATASTSHTSFDDDYDDYGGYDDYDDFGLNFGGVGGGGRTKKSNKSGGVYSSKHIRLVEARKESVGGHAVVGNAKKSTKK